MKVLILGATGMVGQGVLRECLDADDVDQVICLGRTAIGLQHAKLKELIHGNLLELSAIEPDLQYIDACFFCLGVSSSGMTEQDYSRITYDMTLSVAETLARLNPVMTFVYVSGAGTDSTEQGRTMWARVKGKTENALLRLPFKARMFRPGLIEPLDGITSKTSSYRVFYKLAKPFLVITRALLPNMILTTQDIGQAMLNVARGRAKKSILEVSDIRALASWSAPADYTSLQILTKLAPARGPKGRDASGPPTSSAPRSTATNPVCSISERTAVLASASSPE
jgi:uncharacterized protein YbjT (DUF2867 family)